MGVVGRWIAVMLLTHLMIGLLEPTASKIMNMAGGRVQATSETGECCTFLFAIGKLIGSCLHGDSVEVERFNSIIKKRMSTLSTFVSRVA